MNIHRRLRAEDGFSVAEVMIAVAVLFFVLTAIIGLVGLSSTMTVQAKNKAMLTNAVASYIERVRSLKWTEIDGYVSTPREVRSGTSTVTVVASVQTSTTADGQEFLKTIDLTATATMSTLTAPESYAVRVSLRNPDASLNLGGGAPNIDFDNSRTPPEYCVLYDNMAIDSSGTVWPEGATISAVATSPGGVITEVSYKLNGAYLRDQPAPSGSEAVFTISPPAPVVSRQFRWYTNQPGQIDGFQTVEVEATDDVARHVTAYRTFILDNQAVAGPPATMNGWVASSRSLVATWPAVRDAGPDEAPCYAPYYQWQLERETHTAAVPPVWSSPPSWQEAATGTVRAGQQRDLPSAMRWSRASWATMTAPSTADAFSRYRMSVKAAGPRGVLSTGRTYSSQIYITRPEILSHNTPAPFNGYTSSVSITKPNRTTIYDVTLRLSQPHFALSGNPTWWGDLQASHDGVTWTTFAPPATPPGLQGTWASWSSDPHIPATLHFLHENTNQRDELNPVWYYRVGIRFTPLGESTSRILYTNAVGPTPSSAASGTVYPMMSQPFR